MMNVEDLYRLLRTGHMHAQGIVDTVADPMLVLDESLRVQSANRAFFETFKVERYETIGQLVYELGNGQWDIPDLRFLLSQVITRSTAVVNFRVEHDFPDIGSRTMLLTARILYHPDNASHALLLSIEDATKRVGAEAAKDLLFGELRHRMKNLLAVARSIARQTSTEGRSAEEYRDVFLGRFGALTEAQDLAFSEQGESSLGALVKRILEPYSASFETVVIEPSAPVELGPSRIMSLGLILHELATNAAKYGALSGPEGRVRIGWTIDETQGQLRFNWAESGGPSINPPTTTGYGTQLIRSTTTYTLGGQVELEYAPDGLKAKIAIPLGKTSSPPES